MIKSRRSFLRNAGFLACSTALGACSIATSNGVTTVTLNVNEVVADTNIALTIAQTGLGFVGLPTNIGTVVSEGITIIQNGLTAFKKASGGSVSLTFDKTSVPAAFTSLIADLQTASSNISAVAAQEKSALGDALSAKIVTISADIANVASVLQSILSAAVGTDVFGQTPEMRRAIRMEAIKTRYGLV